MQTAVAALAAYLLGSISLAIVVSRLMGLPDPRTYGSRNPGATNVLRSGSRLAAALTLAGDTAKGWLAVWLVALTIGQGAAAGLDVPFAALGVVLGHVFPLYHRFAGGKGVATAAGALLGLDLWLGAATIATWIAIAAFFRYASAASLVAALFAPAYAWWLFGLRPVLPVVAAMALLIAWRHKDNIGRLVSGTESRIGERRAS
ncbi:MAG: glycerol-3-phosphate acyltransferase [Betaproteobacteria bacterium RIFCSPLOWO2_12_FULL_68_20]|nr:MAG: glycerol-3-phosphate acyltransferase [Betaproteobacteria bacterium RIFCSPLOWO2_12_FULL_68_20]